MAEWICEAIHGVDMVEEIAAVEFFSEERAIGLVQAAELIKIQASLERIEKLLQIISEQNKDQQK